MQVSDIAFAHDPETGLAGAREVLATWPNTDTLVEFEVGDGTVTTTEDHEFWNVSDQLWQETCHIDAGDLLLTADGATVEAGTLLWDTAHVAPAFDLTIAEIHTYHVTAGDEEVLVHNNDGPCVRNNPDGSTTNNPDGSTTTIDADGRATLVKDGQQFENVQLDDDGLPIFDEISGQPQPAPPTADRLDEIINDHAFEDHREDFSERLGLESEAEIRAHAEAIIEDPDRFGYQDGNDARWWYDEETRVIVFDDPTAAGTASPADIGYRLPDGSLA